MAALKPACEQRNCKIIGLSVDPVDDHRRWVKDIQEVSGNAVTYPLIGDPDLRVAKLYGMLPATAGETSQGRTPAQNQTVRSVLEIGRASCRERGCRYVQIQVVAGPLKKKHKTLQQ